MVERVECHHRQLDVVWDDGFVLHTNLRRSGAWHLYRSTERWRRPWETLSVAIDVDGFVATCFHAAEVETYRGFDPVRHPSYGTQGPDVCSRACSPADVAASLREALDDDVTIADALLDPRVVRGVGNVFRSEVLFGAGIHPAAPMSRITAEDCADLAARAVGALRTSVAYGHLGGRMSVYGRPGRRCERCGDTIGALKVETGGAVYFCPGCQTRHDPTELTPVSIERPMDPHPAAVQFMAGLPWRLADHRAERQADHHADRHAG